MKLYKIKSFFFLVATILNFSGIAQSNKAQITGLIYEPGNEPSQYSTAVLMNQDSVFMDGTLSLNDGSFLLEIIEPGIYFVLIRNIEFKPHISKPIIIKGKETITLDTIFLETKVFGLDEVVVTGKKALYELKEDRIVMNISAAPAMSGNTGLEVLQRTPGIIVDRQNNSIGMNARGEVLFMINNKVQRAPKAVIMAQLEGMRAENIDRIEIIHQPPSKYDASGAAGIINIVLKKSAQQGTNGSTALTGGYGQREKAGFSLNLNSRKEIFNWYGDYNYNLNRANNFQINHYREFEYQGDNYYHENLVKLRNYSLKQHNGNLGMDMNFDDRTVIGLLLGGATSELVWGSNAESSSFDFVNDQPTGKANYLFNSKTDMSSFIANANVLQKIGSESDLTFNLDYANIQYDNSGGLKNSENQIEAYAYERSTPMEFWITSLDYRNPLGDLWTIETGVKGTFNNTSSSTSMFNTEDKTEDKFNLFPGKDKIDEKMLAGYLSFKGELSEKLHTELGIRYEKYTYDLERNGSETINKTFENPFPYFRLNYDIDSLNSFQLGYNRSITRPSFSHLSTFILILDPSLIVYSNPLLQPTFTNTLRISWQRNYAILSLAYLSRNDLINFYNTVDKEKNLQTSVPINFDKEDIVEAQLIFPFSPATWWEMNWTLNALYHKVKDASNHPVEFKKDIFTYYVHFNSTFLFGNSWTASMDGQYRSAYLGGDQVKFNYPHLNLGLTKKFPSGNSLSLVVLDVANSGGKRNWEYHQPELGIKTFGDNDFSERQVRITYTLLFGNQKLSGKRQRKTGADEEIKDRM